MHDQVHNWTKKAIIFFCVFLLFFLIVKLSHKTSILPRASFDVRFQTSSGLSLEITEIAIKISNTRTLHIMIKELDPELELNAVNMIRIIGSHFFARVQVLLPLFSGSM